jgi:hypothetical protein
VLAVPTIWPHLHRLSISLLQTTTHNLGGVPTPTHNTRGVIVDDSLLYLGHNSPPVACEKSLDPMLHEALLMNQMHDVRGGSTTPLSSATPSLVVKHLPAEEWLRQRHSNEFPLIIRSKEEQLIGHELIKALSNFK